MNAEAWRRVCLLSSDTELRAKRRINPPLFRLRQRGGCSSAHFLGDITGNPSFRTGSYRVNALGLEQIVGTMYFVVGVSKLTDGGGGIGSISRFSFTVGLRSLSQSTFLPIDYVSFS